MEKEFILLQEYCEKSRAEQNFILLLEEEGLIEIEIRDKNRYLSVSRLKELDMFSRLYYDLSVNIEGIDIINNLLNKMKRMEHELSVLRRQSDSESFINDFFEEI